MRTGRRSWLAAGAVSLLAHALVLSPLLFTRAAAPELAPEPPRPPVLVTLFEPPPPPPPMTPATEPAPTEPAPAAAAAPAPPPPRPVAPPPPPAPRPRPAPPSPTVESVAIRPAPAGPPMPTPMPTLGDGQLAGALRAGTGAGAGGGAGAGSGAGGGACDMIGRLEASLRADPDIAAAVARAPGTAGRALLVWNGDWVQSPDQAGRGLAGVRQAIAVEIAFAPRECREQRVRGYAVIALAGGAGAPRLALGGGSWRWSDLLGVR